MKLSLIKLRHKYYVAAVRRLEKWRDDDPRRWSREDEIELRHQKKKRALWARRVSAAQARAAKKKRKK